MSRAKLLDLIRSAGAQGDQALFLRLYTGNRISYPAALAAFRDGVAWAKRVSERSA